MLPDVPLDIWAAFIVGEKTLMATEFWMEDDSVESVAATGRLDDYCNLAILIFAKIINFLTDCQQPGRHPTDEVETIDSLWTELQAWRDHRLKEALPLFRSGKSKHQPFETIIFTHPSSSESVHEAIQKEERFTKLPVCGNTFYHTGSILLLRTGQVRPRVVEKTSGRVSVLAQHTFLHSYSPCIYKVQPNLARSRARWDLHIRHITVGGVSGCLAMKIANDLPQRQLGQPLAAALHCRPGLRQ